ncbi:MAG: hypothetical protein ACO1QS_08460 [Verrucomicrobiota bacterium]
MLTLLIFVCMFVTAILLEVLLFPRLRQGRRLYFGLLLSAFISATVWMLVACFLSYEQWNWKLGSTPSQMVWLALISGLIWTVPCLIPAWLAAWLLRKITAAKDQAAA